MDYLTIRISFQGVFLSLHNSFIQLLRAWVSENLFLGTYYFALWKKLLPFSLGMSSGKGLLAHPGTHCILRWSNHPLSTPLLRFPRACCLRQHQSVWDKLILEIHTGHSGLAYVPI